MGIFNDRMFFSVDKREFFAGKTSPEHEYQTGFFFAECRNDCICKFFPAESGMTAWLVGIYRENGIDQQNTIFCPAAQMT